MNITYEVVPNIISGKDLDYLSDMFNWNYGAYKTTNSSLNSINDEELKQMLNKASDVFRNSIINILSILNGGSNNE